MIIAIDGPAGSGKSTIAREVAKKLGMRYLDTGAMYRTVTLLALEAGLAPDRIDEVAELAASTTMRFVERSDDLTRVFVGDREVTDDIRGRLVSQNVSAVSADPKVREVLSERQRQEVARGDVVIEGRDMGTVVAPQADVKVFLTAGVEERARRRQLQLRQQGVEQSMEELIADIAARDAYDTGRKVSPLRKAPDAVEIDTTGMTIDQVIAEVCALAAARTTRVPAGRQPAATEVTRTLSKWPLSRLLRSPLDTWLYRVAYSLLRPSLSLFFRMQVRGVDNLPQTGPVVVACNHRSNLDPFFLGSAASRQIHFMAKAELWSFKPLGWLVGRLGTFPVNRGAADRKAVERAIDMLGHGAVVGLFPEGHRQRAKELGDIRPGVSLFSLRDGVVTIPAVVIGTDRIVRRGIPRFPRVTIAFGPAVVLPDGAGLSRAERGAETTRRLAEDLRRLLDASTREP